MALHSLYCADVPLRNCSLTHLRSVHHHCHQVSRVHHHHRQVS